MGEVNLIVEVISQVGFPIACVVGLAFFVFKSQTAIGERNKEREERYIEIYRDQLQTNQKFSDTLVSLTETIKDMKNDIEEIRRKVDD